MTNNISTALSEADAEIKLAVDLIYLLEINQVRPDIALKALELVEKDLLNKIKEAENT